MLRLAALLFLAVPAFAAAPDAGVVKPRIAVLYFEPATSNVELQVFTKGLTSLMNSDFVATDRLAVLEREKIEAVLTELKLGETRFADKSTFAKIGKILGVEYLVTGFLITGGNKTKITAQLIKTDQTLFVGQAKVDLDPNDVFAAEEKVVEVLTAQLVKLGAITAAAEPAQKGHKLPFTTAVKYARALDAKDKKDPAEQKKLLTEVIKDQPDFKLAQLDLLSLRD